MSSSQHYAYDGPEPPKYDQGIGQPVVNQQPPHHYNMNSPHYNQNIQQQQQVTVNVVNQQPTSNSMRTWSTSLCGCMEDMASCCCVTWFCPCYTCCDLSTRIGEGCCTPICLTAFGHSVPMVYRTKMRAAHGISGGAIDDCTSVLFCAPCVMCQIKREMDFIQRTTGKPAFH